MTIDLIGRCPACGHCTLVAEDTGRIICANGECPRPAAAAGLLSGDPTTDQDGDDG